MVNFEVGKGFGRAGGFINGGWISMESEEGIRERCGVMGGDDDSEASRDEEGALSIAT